MCNDLQFFKEDLTAHEMIQYNPPFFDKGGYDLPQYKDTFILPSYLDPNKLKEYTTKIEDSGDIIDFRIFPQYGKTAFLIGEESKQVLGYASGDGENFSGCVRR